MTLPNKGGYVAGAAPRKQPKKTYNSYYDRIMEIWSSIMAHKWEPRNFEVCRAVVQKNPYYPTMLKIEKMMHYDTRNTQAQLVQPDTFQFDVNVFLKKNKIVVQHPVIKFKLSWLSERYQKETEKINSLCDNLVSRMESVLSVGPPLPQELYNAKIQRIKDSFLPLKERLRTSIEKSMLKVAVNIPPQSRAGRRSFGERASTILWTWFYRNLDNPYPTEEEKKRLAFMCSLSLKQVNTWFANHRERYKQRYLDRKKQLDQDQGGSQRMEQGLMSPLPVTLAQQQPVNNGLQYQRGPVRTSPQTQRHRYHPYQQ